MSIIIQDSIQILPEVFQKMIDADTLSVLLYADDTLVIGSTSASVQALLNAIATVGRRFGMELHYSKFQLLQVRGDFDIKTPNGERIEPSESMVHLGSTLSADGGAHNELAKKLDDTKELTKELHDTI